MSQNEKENCIITEKQKILFKNRELTLQEKIPIEIVEFLKIKFEKILMAFSGGSDSTLLLLLLIESKQINCIDTIIFNNTRLQSPEIFRYIDTIIERFDLKEKFVTIKPNYSRKQLLKIIEEDIANVTGKKHSKHLYRCCVLAKEKPMNKYLKENELESEKTVLLRGIRANESSQRFMTCLQMIRSGQFYCNKPRYNKKIYVSNPLALMTEQVKWKLLKKLCQKYNIPLPKKSGCIYCPIFAKFDSKTDLERIMKLNKFLNQSNISSYIKEDNYG